MSLKNKSVLNLGAIICFTALINRSFSAVVDVASPTTDDYNVTNHLLPKSIKLGVATSAFQIEGAWNQSGKSPSNMDNLFFQYNDYVTDGATLETVCDSYKKYLEDIEMLKDLKVDVYRFSIPWTRILPTGFVDYINWEAVEHYNNLIDGLLEAGIEPYVTMLHFDNPLVLNDLGRWAQPKLVDYFADYADLLFFLYGDRVKYWITINEPLAECMMFPNMILKGIKKFPAYGHTEYFCMHNLLKAHAKIYRLYERKYKETQRGKISISKIVNKASVANATTEDRDFLDRANMFLIDMLLHPLIKGNYPQVVIETVANKSKEQGFKESRLPEFTVEEIEEMKGTLDFIGISFYGTFSLDRNDTSDAIPSFANDVGGSLSITRGIFVDNYRNLLRYFRDEYGNPEIVITETGNSEGSFNDTSRITYIQVLLSESIKAIEEDDINVTGFIVWSLMDNIQFPTGQTTPAAKMGLYYVDFDDANRTRTPRLSAGYFKEVSETRCLLNSCN